MPRLSRCREFPVNVVGSSTFGRYNRISTEKTYNMFISDDWLINFPGYKKQLELEPGGVGRGQFRSIRGNFLIIVVAQYVYKVDQNLAATQIGTLNTFKGKVHIDENLAFQICVVDGTNAWIYDYNSAVPAFTMQALAANLTPAYVTYHNSFFLFGNSNNTASSASWYAYRFNTATTITLQSTLALQTKPDYPIAVERIPGQAANVLVFGTSVCEVHTQIGGNQNYRRNNSISIDYGCINSATIASSETMIAWLGVNENNAPVIMTFTGQGAQPISTDGIDYLMASLAHPEDSTAMFGRFDGHLVYQLTFYHPNDNITLMYDFTTNKFFHLSDQYLNYHPAVDYSFFLNTTFFLSLNNSALYEINSNRTVIDENIVNFGNPNYDEDLIYEMQRIRISRNMSRNDNDKFMLKSLSLVIEQGNDENYTGLQARGPNYIITEDIFNPANDIIVTEWGDPLVLEQSNGAAGGVSTAYAPYYRPRVDLQMSKDGGETWSTIVSRILHPLGERKNILTWDRLGKANVVTFKLRFWGTTRFVVNDGIVWMTQ